MLLLFFQIFVKAAVHSWDVCSQLFFLESVQQLLNLELDREQKTLPYCTYRLLFCVLKFHSYENWKNAFKYSKYLFWNAANSQGIKSTPSSIRRKILAFLSELIKLLFLRICDYREIKDLHKLEILSKAYSLEHPVILC